MAEQVFRSLEPLDARAYNTLIKGMAKYHQVRAAGSTQRLGLGKFCWGSLGAVWRRKTTVATKS